MATKKKNTGRNKRGQFVKGAKAAEKWTEKTVMPILKKIWESLIEGHEDVRGNVVRANDIKLLGEVCLMHNVTKQRWNEWKEKFKDNAAISDLIKKIVWVLECRLNYSGQTMDIFILKNHYAYRDKIEHGVTDEEGKDVKQVFVVNGKEIQF